MDFLSDPAAIEKKSMEIIEQELAELELSGPEGKVIQRVIHATADKEFAELVIISSGAIENGLRALEEGANIVTDVNMLKSGISKRKTAELGNEIKCFISDEETAVKAKELGITRSMMSMRRAAKDDDNKIFAIGNAPTALFELIRLIRDGQASPDLIVGTPVGFVGAKEAKAELEKLADVPWITVRGKKGGSAVAASVMNALLYMI